MITTVFVVFLTVVSWGAVVFIFETLVLYSKIWPAPNVRVFIDQLVEHCSANSEAMGSNPVKVPKLFRVNKQLLKLQLPNCNSYPDLFPHFTSSSF